VTLSRYLLREPGHSLSRTASLIFLEGTLCIVDRLQSIMRVPPTSDPGFQAVKREKGIYHRITMQDTGCAGANAVIAKTTRLSAYRTCMIDTPLSANSPHAFRTISNKENAAQCCTAYRSTKSRTAQPSGPALETISSLRGFEKA
jgi:hypothetical protein